MDTTTITTMITTIQTTVQDTLNPILNNAATMDTLRTITAVGYTTMLAITTVVLIGIFNVLANYKTAQ